MVKRLFGKTFLFVFLILTISLHVQLAEIKEDQAKTEEPRVLSARDTLRINGVSGARISPDGQWVLYTKQIRDMEDKDLKSTTHIWRVRIDGSDRRQMTYGTASCTSPSWFPCGKKIAFISSRSGSGASGAQEAGPGRGPKSQVYFMYVDGGEAWQATEHNESVQSYEISPDGSRILFTAREPLSKEEEEKRKEKDDA